MVSPLCIIFFSILHIFCSLLNTLCSMLFLILFSNITTSFFTSSNGIFFGSIVTTSQKEKRRMRCCPLVMQFSMNSCLLMRYDSRRSRFKRLRSTAVRILREIEKPTRTGTFVGNDSMESKLRSITWQWMCLPENRFPLRNTSLNAP